MLEIMQTRFVEGWSQQIYNILRELLFAFPRRAQSRADGAIAARTARRTRSFERLPTLQQSGQILLPKMLFGVECAFEDDGLRFFQRAVSRRRTRLLFP